MGIARVVNKKVYQCICELPGCPGQRKPWLSKELRIPPRCAFCHKFTWYRGDLRRKEPLPKPAKRTRQPKIELPKPTRVRSLEDE
jgi:hypothetical protein